MSKHHQRSIKMKEKYLMLGLIWSGSIILRAALFRQNWSVERRSEFDVLPFCVDLCPLSTDHSFFLALLTRFRTACLMSRGVLENNIGESKDGINNDEMFIGNKKFIHGFNEKMSKYQPHYGMIPKRSRLQVASSNRWNKLLNHSSSLYGSRWFR